MLNDPLSEETWLIPFTQYLRPDGRTKEIQFETSKELYDKAQLILAEGFVFECEILQTGHASATITDPELGDYRHALGENAPGFKEKVEQMILSFDAEAAAGWRREEETD